MFSSTTDQEENPERKPPANPAWRYVLPVATCYLFENVLHDVANFFETIGDLTIDKGVHALHKQASMEMEKDITFFGDHS